MKKRINKISIGVNEVNKTFVEIKVVHQIKIVRKALKCPKINLFFIINIFLFKNILILFRSNSNKFFKEICKMTLITKSS